MEAHVSVANMHEQESAGISTVYDKYTGAKKTIKSDNTGCTYFLRVT